jgi:CubicO group peptidase (beta-lactamase class C family)
MGQIFARTEADLDRLNATVEAGALKASARAVLCGVWVHDREVMIAARGWSMTTTPVSSNMHFRAGGIFETFMSTLLLMLVERGLISLDEKISRWFPNLLAADQATQCGCW